MKIESFKSTEKRMQRSQKKSKKFYNNTGRKLSLMEGSGVHLSYFYNFFFMLYASITPY